MPRTIPVSSASRADRDGGPEAVAVEVEDSDVAMKYRISSMSSPNTYNPLAATCTIAPRRRLFERVGIHRPVVTAATPCRPVRQRQHDRLLGRIFAERKGRLRRGACNDQRRTAGRALELPAGGQIVRHTNAPLTRAALDRLGH